MLATGCPPPYTDKSFEVDKCKYELGQNANEIAQYYVLASLSSVCHKQYESMDATTEKMHILK